MQKAIAESDEAPKKYLYSLATSSKRYTGVLCSVSLIRYTKRWCIPPAEVPGHNILLDLGNSSFVVYAHLKPGSIRAQVGQKVRAGDALGLVGNSGGSTAPHLHLHLVNGPSAVAADGTAFLDVPSSMKTARDLRILDLRQDDILVEGLVDILGARPRRTR